MRRKCYSLIVTYQDILTKESYIMAQKNKAIWLSVMATTLALTLSACGSKSADSGKKQSVTIMSKDVISTMDPALATDTISGQAMENVYSGLYRYDGNKLKPDMASKMATVSKDQKTYTFTIRKGAKWSDGKEVTAKDFEYAWQRAVTPATKSEYAYIFSGIKNADAITAGKKAPSTLGAKAIGKYKFQVTLEKPIPYFQSMITLQTFDPVEKSQVTKWGKKYGTSAKTLTFNGPYVMKKWNGSDNTWKQTKNSKYWNAKNVHITTIKNQVVKDNSTALNLFQADKITDVAVSGDTAMQMKNDKAYNVVGMNATYYLEMNQQRIAGFKNQKIREALSLAVNRKSFIKKVLGDGSEPIATVVPSKMMYNDKTGKDFGPEAAKKVQSYASYDLSKAKKLFAEGMKEAGQKNLEFTITSDDTDAAKSTLEYLQNAFSKLSSSDAKITVKTKSVPFKTRVSLSMAHKTDMVVTAWSADFPDAISFLSLFTTGASYNMGNISDSHYDKLISAANTTDATNTTKRWNDMQEAAQYLTKKSLVIPMYQVGTAHLTKITVKNMRYTPNSLINFVGATNK